MNSNKYICKKINKEPFESVNYCSPDAFKDGNKCCTKVEEIVDGKPKEVNKCIDVTDHGRIQELKIKDKLYVYFNGKPHLFNSLGPKTCPDFFHQWDEKNACFADMNKNFSQTLCGDKNYFIPPNICGNLNLIDSVGNNKGTLVNNVYINQENVTQEKSFLANIPTPVVIGVGSAVGALLLAALL